MFKAIFIRIIVNDIKETPSIITITRVILIIETIFISTTKPEQKTILKKFVCYICDKIDYYKKDYIMQD